MENVNQRVNEGQKSTFGDLAFRPKDGVREKRSKKGKRCDSDDDDNSGE